MTQAELADGLQDRLTDLVLQDEPAWPRVRMWKNILIDFAETFSCQIQEPASKYGFPGAWTTILVFSDSSRILPTGRAV